MSEQATLPVEEYKQKYLEQPMLRPKIAALIINVSLGVSGDPIVRAKSIVRTLTNQEPVETIAKQTWRSFGVRKHQPVGIKVTLRGQPAYDLLLRLIHAKDYKLNQRSIDRFGNFGFGIREHIDIPGMSYEPTLGIIGMDVIIQMERLGYRVKKRSYRRASIGKHHYVSPVETRIFLQENYGVTFI